MNGILDTIRFDGQLRKSFTGIHERLSPPTTVKELSGIDICDRRSQVQTFDLRLWTFDYFYAPEISLDWKDQEFLYPRTCNGLPRQDPPYGSLRSY